MAEECKGCSTKKLVYMMLIFGFSMTMAVVSFGASGSNTNNEQDKDIALTTQRLNAFENMMSDTNRQLGDVINLIRESNKMQNALNIRLETHIARGE